jgi:YYY domain-containing protein
MPPAIQWADRSPLLDSLRWMFVFTVGPGITLLAAIGAVALLGPRRWPSTLHRQRWVQYVLVGGAVVPFVIAGRGFVHTGRYTMPMLPAMCVLGGLGVVSLARLARRSSSTPVRRAAPALAIVLLSISALWTVAFVNGVFGREHTRIAATQWIVANVPAGSGISSQAWDDALPLGLPGVDLSRYRNEQLQLVGTDDVAKIVALARQLQTVDYVVESSPRLWGTVTRIPSRFPSTIEFFEALDDGSLGFTRVATFDTGPELGPFRLDDSTAEEAFSVYDHPEVRIWQKTRPLDPEAIVERLDPIAAANAVNTHATDAHANGLLLDEAVIADLADGPTYDEQFDTTGNGLTQALGWLLLLELLAAATFVLMLPLLRSLPDAGAGVSKILALAVLSIGSFVASAWLGVPLGRGWSFVAVIALLGGGLLAARRRRHELADLWRRRRALLVGAEVVGLLAFALVLWLRAADPDLWHPARGGEKPFEMALMTAVLRSDTLAPYDPWFSGGSLNYYYGGWLLLLAPAKLLRTAPAHLMNIGLAVFAWSIAGAAWTVGAALSGLGRRVETVARRTVVGASLAVGLVLAASNMDVIAPAWAQLRGASTTFDWWSRSRVIPESVAITEFPAWSLLFGDLHPHVMGIALVLALGAVALGLRAQLIRGSRAGTITAATLAGLLVGQIRATNTWDLVLAVSLVAVCLVACLVEGAPRRLCALAAACGAVAVTVVWRPYVRQTVVFDRGVTAGELVTPVSSWLQQFGLFLAISVVASVLPLRRARRRSARQWGRIRTADMVVVGAALVATGVIMLAPHRAVAVLCAVLSMALAWSAWTARGRRDAAALALLTLAGGWTIQMCVELFTISNDGGRQNTVFKFWYQSWILLAVGSAAVLATAIVPLRARPDHDRLRRGVRLTAVVLVATSVVTAVGFWAYSLPPRLDDRISGGGPTLDGEAYLRVPFEVGVGDGTVVPSEDLPLVDWLRANVHGVHVIAEMPGLDYQWTSRMSWSTGLPTPVGWQYHQSQQRRTDGGVLERRAADMRELYVSTDPAAIARVLAERRIVYLVFGTVERSVATPESRQALLDHRCLSTLWQSDEGFFISSVDSACVREMRPLGG